METVKETLEQHKELSIDDLRQETFEKYITNTLPKNFTDQCVYGENDGFFTFTNGISFYKLTNPLIISKYILERNHIGFTNQSRLVSSRYFDPIFKRLSEWHDHDESEAALSFVKTKEADEEAYILQDELEEITTIFKGIEITNLKIFLGDTSLGIFLNESQIYLSKNEPMLYCENSYGYAYILGKHVD